MPDPKHEWTAYLDGTLDPRKAHALDREPQAACEKAAWARLRSDLVRELTPPPCPHPDFINSSVKAAIERAEHQAAARSPSRARGLAWWGLGGLAAAASLTALLFPQALRMPSENEFISQVVSARSSQPKVSISAFKSPSDRGVVLWIEGANYIDPNERVQ